jgi:hypothetical protein
MPGPDPITIENHVHPGTTYEVDAALHQAMVRAILKVLPLKAPDSRTPLRWHRTGR